MILIRMIWQRRWRWRRQWRWGWRWQWQWQWQLQPGDHTARSACSPYLFHTLSTANISTLKNSSKKREIVGQVDQGGRGVTPQPDQNLLKNFTTIWPKVVVYFCWNILVLARYEVGDHFLAVLMLLLRGEVFFTPPPRLSLQTPPQIGLIELNWI